MLIFILGNLVLQLLLPNLGGGEEKAKKRKRKEEGKEKEEEKCIYSEMEVWD